MKTRFTPATTFKVVMASEAASLKDTGSSAVREKRWIWRTASVRSTAEFPSMSQAGRRGTPVAATANAIIKTVTIFTVLINEPLIEFHTPPLREAFLFLMVQHIRTSPDICQAIFRGKRKATLDRTRFGDYTIAVRGQDRPTGAGCRSRRVSLRRGKTYTRRPIDGNDDGFWRT